MAADLAAGTTLAGYRIQDLVGRGAMGVVYRATQLSLEREVALKLVVPELASDEAFRERFLREARIAASLEHPHILPVHEAGDVDGVLYLSMRFVEGGDLGRRLEREGSLAPVDACALLTQLAAALDHAHGRGLCHRDVKPQNVLFDSAGNAYLCDFGLAGELLRTGDDGVLEGTLAYLAPERLEGGAALPASDLYGLACLAYELLTGSPPFVREHEAALLYAHMREEPPSLAAQGLTRLDPVFARALAKDPAERYASCADFATALSEALRRPEPREGRWPDTFPRPATRLVGRRQEIDEVRRLLSDSETRLLTLTGAGGTGKTRLALHAAAESEEAFPDGVFWIGLASLRDPQLVLETISQTLGATDGLVERIGEQRLLLLVDNLEHLIDAAPELASLLGKCPNLIVLVTSRELLRVSGEIEYPVPPLAEPEAVSLFCERAHLQPSSDIAELCMRLDSLPLAVELAAARTRAFSPAQILGRLAGHLEILRGGRDADPRQQTLRATIEWSYDLLTSEEQQLFARMSVFAGGCTLEAAEEIADASLDPLQSLVEKSLLRFSSERFWMLATIREFAGDCLAEGRASSDLQLRHAVWFAALAERAEKALRGSDARQWLDKLELEQDNIRAALAWLLEANPERALDLAARLSRFWVGHGHLSEGRRWLTESLARAVNADIGTRALALKGAGNLATVQGDYELATSLYDESLALRRKMNDDSGAAGALANLGLVAAETGELERARDLLDESLAIRRRIGDRWGVAMCLNNLGLVALYGAEYERAVTLYDESLVAFRELGDEQGIADSLLCKGRASLHLSDLCAAALLFQESLELSDGLGDRWALAECLEGIAAICAASGESRTAAQLFGAAEALRAEIGAPLSANDHRRYVEFETLLSRELGPDAERLAREEGGDLPLADAIGRARDAVAHYAGIADRAT